MAIRDGVRKHSNAPFAFAIDTPPSVTKTRCGPATNGGVIWPQQRHGVLAIGDHQCAVIPFPQRPSRPRPEDPRNLHLIFVIRPLFRPVVHALIIIIGALITALHRQ
jgi:hypothetical protein